MKSLKINTERKSTSYYAKKVKKSNKKGQEGDYVKYKCPSLRTKDFSADFILYSPFLGIILKVLATSKNIKWNLKNRGVIQFSLQKPVSRVLRGFIKASIFYNIFIMF